MARSSVPPSWQFCSATLSTNKCAALCGMRRHRPRARLSVARSARTAQRRQGDVPPSANPPGGARFAYAVRGHRAPPPAARPPAARAPQQLSARRSRASQKRPAPATPTTRTAILRRAPHSSRSAAPRAPAARAGGARCASPRERAARRGSSADAACRGRRRGAGRGEARAGWRDFALTAPRADCAAAMECILSA